MRRRAASVVGARLGVLVSSAEQQAGLATTSSGGLFGTAGRLPGAGARVGGAGQARAAAAVPAATAAVKVQPSLLPLTRTDEFGAVSILESEAEASFVPQTFENVDGRRIEDGRYAAFTKDLTGEAGSMGVDRWWECVAGPTGPPAIRVDSCGCQGQEFLSLSPSWLAAWCCDRKNPCSAAPRAQPRRPPARAAGATPNPPRLLPGLQRWREFRPRASSQTKCARLHTAQMRPSTASTPRWWSRCGPEGSSQQHSCLLAMSHVLHLLACCCLLMLRLLLSIPYLP